MPNTNPNQPASKAPTHIAYSVREVEGKEPFWTRIGSAWLHRDGQGLSIQLATTPLDGRITLRTSNK